MTSVSVGCVMVKFVLAPSQPEKSRFDLKIKWLFAWVVNWNMQLFNKRVRVGTQLSIDEPVSDTEVRTLVSPNN